MLQSPFNHLRLPITIMHGIDNTLTGDGTHGDSFEACTGRMGDVSELYFLERPVKQVSDYVQNFSQILRGLKVHATG
jgi:hypothetical protein